MTPLINKDYTSHLHSHFTSALSAWNSSPSVSRDLDYSCPLKLPFNTVSSIKLSFHRSRRINISSRTHRAFCEFYLRFANVCDLGTNLFLWKVVEPKDNGLPGVGQSFPGGAVFMSLPPCHPATCWWGKRGRQGGMERWQYKSHLAKHTNGFT